MTIERERTDDVPVEPIDGAFDETIFNAEQLAILGCLGCSAIKDTFSTIDGIQRCTELPASMIHSSLWGLVRQGIIPQPGLVLRGGESSGGPMTESSFRLFDGFTSAVPSRCNKLKNQVNGR